MADAVMYFQRHYRFLSNFWPANVVLDGETFATVEHAYQAAKFDDADRRRQIREQPTPGQAKRLANSWPYRPAWNNKTKLAVMLDLLRQKFKDADLRKQLLDTEDAELIEGNNWGDTFWGVCRGRGENHLGKLLMQVRSEVSTNG